jgi:hypothetical protein
VRVLVSSTMQKDRFANKLPLAERLVTERSFLLAIFS